MDFAKPGNLTAERLRAESRYWQKLAQDFGEQASRLDTPSLRARGEARAERAKRITLALLRAADLVAEEDSR